MAEHTSDKTTESNNGKLRIGDDWNANIKIALSQNDPLKAIAEFVENSIDAKAANVTIVRGKDRGDHYLKIIDDGSGISDLRHVATHIGDSIKRKLKKAGVTGIQGEFGIGLMSFWTVGGELTITSSTDGNEALRMTLVKGNPAYAIRPAEGVFHQKGTEVFIRLLLSGIRSLSGEKIQNYLASELRDRLAKSGCRVRIIDKTSRKECTVEPQAFSGRLLLRLPEVKKPLGDIWYELYVNDPAASTGISLCKDGTRVLPLISSLECFNRSPWSDPALEGSIDASLLQLTPGTRNGVIQDEYGWMGIRVPIGGKQASSGSDPALVGSHSKSAAIENSTTSDLAPTVNQALAENSGEAPWPLEESTTDRSATRLPFYEVSGGLHSASILPAKVVVHIGRTKRLRVVPKDIQKRPIEAGLEPSGSGSAQRRGLPGYTFIRAPGELWRSVYGPANDLIRINNAHADFLYASRDERRKLRYITRLFAKELVLVNFPEADRSQPLERLIELQLYAEERL